MTHINPRVVAHIANNNGLITPQRARDLGMSNTWIRHQLRERSWLVLHRGVYVDAEVWHALDPWHEQPLLRARAALLVMRREAVLSHDSAVHAHALDYLEPPDPPGVFVHITRPGSTNAWTKNGVKHHLARYAREDVVELDGLRALDRARTVVDVAREHGFRGGLVTANSALRQGVTKNDLWNVADGMECWPYITIVRSVIEHGDGRAQNTIESLGLDFVLELGIGVPDLQWPMWRTDGRVAWCDIRVGRHIFETHGQIKVLTPEQGGVADRSATQVLWDTRKRERLVTAEGLGVSNLYWDDFFSGRADAKARVRAEVQQTIDRYGDNVLPERLERNAREIRSREQRPDAS